MPTMPYVEPPYQRPDSHLYALPAIGPVGASPPSPPLAELPGDGPPDGSLTDRYWAALAAAAGSRVPPEVHGHAAIAPSRARTVIAQRDTLSLHPITAQENPFESLIEHVMHWRLPRRDEPLVPPTGP